MRSDPTPTGRLTTRTNRRYCKTPLPLPAILSERVAMWLTKGLVRLALESIVLILHLLFVYLVSLTFLRSFHSTYPLYSNCVALYVLSAYCRVATDTTNVVRIGTYVIRSNEPARFWSSRTNSASQVSHKLSLHEFSKRSRFCG